MKSIVLVGMSGVGKSVEGEFISAKLTCKFYDTDKLIELDEGKTVSEIFLQKGEEYFRKLEREKINSLPCQNAVISIGGGAFEDIVSREYLLENFLVIYLQAQAETVFQRIKDKTDRPLLKSNPFQNIKNLLSKREKNYKLAHFTVITDNKTVEQVADEILECVNLK